MKYIYEVPKEIEVDSGENDEGGKPVLKTKKTHLTGTIEMELASHKEAMVQMKAIKLDENGKALPNTGLDTLEEIFKLCDGKVTAVKIKSTKGHQITSLEDLGCFEVGRVIIGKIGNILLRGVSLGED